MTKDPETSGNAFDSSASRLGADDVKRVVCDILAQRARDGLRVEFGVASFFDAPDHPVWLVYANDMALNPARGALLVGASHLFAICPETGRVLFEGMVGQ